MLKRYIGYFLVYSQIFIIAATAASYFIGTQTSSFTNGEKTDHFYNYLNAREVVAFELIGNIIGNIFSFSILWVLGILFLNYRSKSDRTFANFDLPDNLQNALPFISWLIFTIILISFNDDYREFEVAAQCLGLAMAAISIFFMRDGFNAKTFNSFISSIFVFNIPNIIYVKNYILIGQFAGKQYIPLFS